MQIGIDSFVAAVPDTLTGENLGPADRLSHLLEEIQSADRVGLDVFGIGEHHRAEFLDSAPETILAAAAVRTERIRLTSAVTVLSANDPVRIFQQFATIDPFMASVDNRHSVAAEIRPRAIAASLLLVLDTAEREPTIH
jgi:hypothetical protein